MKGTRLLDAIERAGNRLPHPTVLFVLMAALVLVLSALAAALGLNAQHPVSGQSFHAVNLLNTHGLHRILSETVQNFVTFAPVGAVLVAILGIGVAEHSGLLACVLRATVLKAPRQLLTFLVVVAGVLSSLAMDTGYVVLMPLAGLIFHSAGRHPLTGIAAAFAGVSGGYSANLLITPVDALLAGISTEAAGIIDNTYSVNAAANYYFLIVSTLLVGLVGTLITELIVARRLGAYHGKPAEVVQQLAAPERRGLWAVAAFTGLFILAIVWGLLPDDGFLRDRESGTVLQSPFIQGIVTVVAAYTAVAGILFGRVSGRYRRSSDFVQGMEEHMGTLASYLVLMFFAAQFVNYFAWSNLGSIIAMRGAELLTEFELGGGWLLLCFIALAALINLFVGSASAKWALIAPVFVPMLMLAGITPEATQMAFRIGDSTTNIITPLMPYFGVVIAFAQRYDKDIGLGTLIALMLPYSLAFLLSWSALLLLWILFDWPLGPGASIFLS